MSFFAAAVVVRFGTTGAFTSPLYRASGQKILTRFMATSSSSIDQAVESHISRLETLQSLLSKHGAPGSKGCSRPNDLVPVSNDDESSLLDLHPHLYPIAVSSNTGNYVCALRRAYADDADYESSNQAPWPIVESKINGAGYNLLAINSEHFMRRIVAEVDGSSDDEEKNNAEEVIDLYNQGLGAGTLKDKALDIPYEAGSVEKLGYGVDKYILLRVGPFPDLYQRMSQNHIERGDESSALIAAEAANGKFVGFGSTFASYANLLSTLDNRADEARDAARMCLRLPIPSIGLDSDELVNIARKCDIPGFEKEENDVALEKMKDYYEKIRKHEEDDDETKANMTPEQIAIDEVNYILDTTSFDPNRKWSSTRKKIGEIYKSAGMNDMAIFIDSNLD